MLKKQWRALLCAVFYAALYLGLHYGLAFVPLGGDAALRTILANVLAVVIAVMTARALDERPLRVGASFGGWTLLVSGLLGGAFAGVVMACMTWMPVPTAWMEAYTTSAGDPSERSLAALVSALVLAPMAEEIVFRGLIYRSLKQAMGAIPAALAVSIGFGLIHGTVLWCIYTFVLSLLAVWVMERADSVWAAVAFHGMFNLCGMLPAFLSLPPWADTAYLIIGVAVFLASGSWLLFHRTR